jgi:phosphomevalonate kinase
MIGSGYSLFKSLFGSARTDRFYCEKQKINLDTQIDRLDTSIKKLESMLIKKDAVTLNSTVGALSKIDELNDDYKNELLTRLHDVELSDDDVLILLQLAISRISESKLLSNDHRTKILTTLMREIDKEININRLKYVQTN